MIDVDRARPITRVRARQIRAQEQRQRGAKIFCIGPAKTGTTSLAAFFEGLGLALGDRPVGERLVHEWARRNFTPIIALADPGWVHLLGRNCQVAHEVVAAPSAER